LHITPVNDAPVAVDNQAQLLEDGSFEVNVLGNDTDVDAGDSLDIASVTVVKAPTKGKAVVTATGAIVYTPEPNSFGDDVFTYTVKDSQGAVSNEATVNMTITPVNDAPTATAQHVELKEDEPIVITLRGEDIELEPLTYAISEQPAHGTLELVTTNEWRYTPALNFNGEDKFTFVANDGKDNSAPATVTLNVLAVNDAPLADAKTLVVNEDEVANLVLTGTDVDNSSISFEIASLPVHGSASIIAGILTYVPDADFNGKDTLTVVAFDGELRSEPAAIEVTVNATNDAPQISGVPATSVKVGESYSFTPAASDIDGQTLTFTIKEKPSWANFDSQTGTLSGVPARANVGVNAGIVIGVSDGTASVSLAAFDITVVATNVAPVASNMDITVTEDGTRSLILDALDQDNDTLQVTLTTQPQHGQVKVDGLVFSYTPLPNFNGADSFSYKVSDGEFDSNEATVNISVTSVNDAPQAVNDSFVFNATAENRYELDVLANDIDVDDAQSALSIVSAKTSIGTVAITSNRLVLNPTGEVNGAIAVSYLMRDPAGATSRAAASVTINNLASTAPTLVLPADVSVRATGLFTRVDLGTASATDANGNAIPVSIENGQTLFAPGNHSVYWKATDAQGRTSFATQSVKVEPLVSISKDSTVIEESSKTISVFLNGESPTYPVVVPYSVGGTATAADHNLVDGEVVIASGTEGQITFDVFADTLNEGTETIVVTLGESVNRGAKTATIVSIVENNVAPELALNVTQQNEERALVTKSGGLVSINAQVVDINPNDTVNLTWQANKLENVGSEPLQFQFDPSNAAVGVYSISAVASDNGEPSLSTKHTVYVEVIEVLSTLTDQDSDGDLIPDDQEGYKDSDNDGIPDYLDAIADCNVIQQRALESQQFLAEGSPGVCIRKGSNVPQNQTGGVEILTNELPQDADTTNIGGIFDFIASGLPNPGDTYQIVLPQREPIPENPVYRKIRDGQWVDFVLDGSNRLFSSPGEKGYCPPPGDAAWVTGLTAGHWCVQVELSDGGPNDDDGIVNGSIVDPGGVAVVNNGNALPVVQNDSVTTRQGQVITIDVLANDTDADNDVLEITSATADFGQVAMVNNQLTYTPPTNLLGLATILYGVTDNKGGTASGQVTVDIKLNQAPITLADTVEITQGQKAIVDVLANDSDPEGDALTLMDALAQNGVITVADNKVSYVPNQGFTGVDVVTYYVQDALGASSSGTLSVTVKEDKPVVNQVTSSSSGSVGWFSLLLGSGLMLLRRFRGKGLFIVPTAVIGMSSMMYSPDSLATEGWSAGAGLTRSNATSVTFPSGWQGSESDYSKSDSGYYVEAGYYFDSPFSIKAQYQDLGELSHRYQYQGELGNDVPFTAPVLGRAINLLGQYSVLETNDVTLQVIAGIQSWRSELETVVSNGVQVNQTQSGTEFVWGLGASYAVSEQWVLTIKGLREKRDHNDINTLSLGVERRF
jgi:hypothetical protein